MAVVGAGFAGLGVVIRLLQEGYRDVLLLERADEVGGTWRDNTYPGCACDVPSHLYSFSFAPNPDWSRRFAPQAEIGHYLRRCADEYGVRPHLRLGCELRHARWDAGDRVWRLETGDGPMAARILVLAQGPLSEPAVPRLPGLDGFEGEAFHSARWNHDLDLRGLRVGVVGTGASAVQFVPHLQRTAGHVTLFQRTPPWVAPRRDRVIPPWRRSLFRLVPTAQRLARGGEYLAREATLPALLGNRTMRALGRRAALAHLRRQVADPVLRGKLTPGYELGCKRVLLADDYYPALTRSNVAVVTDRIVEVGARSVVTAGGPAPGAGAPQAGDAHPVDVLIFGTGFRVTDATYPHDIVGSRGRSLHEVWDGSPQAYLGTTVTGFPNLFLMAGPNTGLGHNSLIYMIESQIAYLLGCLRAMRERGADTVEVRAEVQEVYNAGLQRRLASTVWATGGCASWYRDRHDRITALWPEPTWRFRRATAGFDPAAHILSAAGRPCPTH
ncbi:NAD(P)/FAD-dependent oxidoreductase [Planomonospora sp. ID67723]|uniref:flavin-containing monooxygenase n=1 Tax=Planomonospora sp. ID67723 TaxID=2738134 RepID=UPI0027DBADE1|nr:NAD(P)/FAD-dependent oxidoreductase [Planomonospora sp. ID67723]